jgi:hypothetical protein
MTNPNTDPVDPAEQNGEDEDDGIERTPEEQAAWKKVQEARRDAKHPKGGPPGQAKKSTGGSEPAGEA